jgi:hypothetical protein
VSGEDYLNIFIIPVVIYFIFSGNPLLRLSDYVKIDIMTHPSDPNLITNRPCVILHLMNDSVPTAEVNIKKAVPLHAMKVPGGKGGIAPTHS